MTKQLIVRITIVSLLLSLINVECNVIKYTFINPYERVLKLLQREPPLKLPTNNRNIADVKEYWLEQKLDHFSMEKNNNRTWLMRYMSNDKYFKDGGPIFIFVGGEWEISGNYLVTGHMYDMAKENAGMLYYTEHRYYGKTLPANDLTFKYLNVQQALADLAYFISYQKTNIPGLRTSKVILVGGSYSGSMVAWFTKKYPNMAAAAWASSAPLKAKMDFYEYMEVTGESIKQKGGSECYRYLKLGAESLAQKLHSSDGAYLLKYLQICDNFKRENPLDVAALFNAIGNYFSGIVQNYSSQIKRMCTSLKAMDSNAAKAFIKYIKYVFTSELTDDRRNDDDNWCLDASFDGMKRLYASDDDYTSGSRQWFYQTCNEFGWYTTTATSQQHPFSQQVPLKYFQQLCHNVFGTIYTLANMSHGIRETNNNFPNSSIYDNVIFTHGQLDPWRAIGLQMGSNVHIIPDYSHTEDLSSINFNDNIQLNIVKLKVATFLRRFLKDE